MTTRMRDFTLADLTRVVHTADRKARPTYWYKDVTDQAGPMDRDRAAYLIRAARSRGERITRRWTHGGRKVTRWATLNIYTAPAMMF